MIDWDRINELRDEIGDEDFAEVVVLFLAEVEEVIDELRSGIDAKDVESKMHFLKGSALNLGFRALAELCEKNEHSAKAGAADDVNQTEVVACYDQSKLSFETNEEMTV